MEKVFTCKHEGKMTSLWTSAELKLALFRAKTLHNRLFSEAPTVYPGKHIVLRHFHHSYLKANKVSKGKGIRKVEYAYHFLKVCWCCLLKIIKISPCLLKLQFAKFGAFFETQWWPAVCAHRKYKYIQQSTQKITVSNNQTCVLSPAMLDYFRPSRWHN